MKAIDAKLDDAKQHLINKKREAVIKEVYSKYDEETIIVREMKPYLDRKVDRIMKDEVIKIEGIFK